MDRTKHLVLADAAVTRAERLAGHAEDAAHGGRREASAMYATVTAAWSDIARTHAAIAATLTTTTED